MKILRSFGYAWNGLKYSFDTQTNFKIHLLLAAMAILAGFGLHISNTEWLIVFMCFAIVLSTELMNTAIEKLADVVHQDIHSGIKLVKDIAAGAVLISALISVMIACIIFLPKIIYFIKSI